MDTPTHITVSRDSAIMASGTAPSPFRLRKTMLLAALLGGLMLFLGAIGYAFAMPVPIPEDTSLLVSLPPGAAGQLLPNGLDKSLPNVWQLAAMNKNLNQTVVLGAYLRDNRWETFAIVPRWSPALPAKVDEPHGAYRLIADQELPVTRRGFSMFEPWGWPSGLPHATAKAWVDPRPFLAAGEPFTVALAGRLALTSLDLPKTDGAALKQTDISLNVPQKPDELGLVAALSDSLRVGDRSYAELDPKPTQVNLQMDASGHPIQTSLVFDHPPTADEAQKLYAAFGFVDGHSIQLGDGTVVQEETFLSSTSGTSLYDPHDNADHERLQLVGQELDFGPADGTSTISAPAQACGLDSQTLRLSAPTLQTSLSELGIAVPSPSAIQFGSKNGKLAFCFE